MSTRLFEESATQMLLAASNFALWGLKKKLWAVFEPVAWPTVHPELPFPSPKRRLPKALSFRTRALA
ncbi:hypothetical protein D3C86_2154790 [compost metagenome]